jgi:aspartate carbamoyltransferase catalytic subunit
MQLKNLIDLDRLTLGEIHELIKLSNNIRNNPWVYRESCRGKIMASLFTESAVAAQMAFQAAMYRLGGEVIRFDSPDSTSFLRQSSLKTAVSAVGGCADLLVLRSTAEGTAAAAALYSSKPVINAGDGEHLRPCETLSALAAISNKKGRLDHLCVGLCGNLKNSPEALSLIQTFMRYKGNRFVLISSPEDTLPQYIKDSLDAAGCQYTEASGLDEMISALDVLYITCTKKENIGKDEHTERKRILSVKVLGRAKKDLMVIPSELCGAEMEEDAADDERVVDLTEYGLYTRMALILTLLQNAGSYGKRKVPHSTHPSRCTNPKCVTRTEPYLPNLFSEAGDMLECKYCEGRMLI